MRAAVVGSALLHVGVLAWLALATPTELAAVEDSGIEITLGSNEEAVTRDEAPSTDAAPEPVVETPVQSEPPPPVASAPEPESTVETPPPPPAPRPKPRPPKSKPTKAGRAVAPDEAKAPRPTAVGGESGASSPSEVPAPKMIAPAPAGSTSANADQLRAWLERHKEYPRRARERRIEGTVLLRFTVDADGRVSSRTIERGSGSELLDRAVIDMIERASPLPTGLDRDRVSSLTVVVPVTFSLK